jgi:hypothetical protein
MGGLCVETSNVPEKHEAVVDAGTRFVEAMLAIWRIGRAGGLGAKARVLEHYLWPKIAREIERAYFQVLGWEQAKVAKKPSLGTKEVDENGCAANWLTGESMNFGLRSGR